VPALLADYKCVESALDFGLDITPQDLNNLRRFKYLLPNEINEKVVEWASNIKAFGHAILSTAADDVEDVASAAASTPKWNGAEIAETSGGGFRAEDVDDGGFFPSQPEQLSPKGAAAIEADNSEAPAINVSNESRCEDIAVVDPSASSASSSSAAKTPEPKGKGKFVLNIDLPSTIPTPLKVDPNPEVKVLPAKTKGKRSRDASPMAKKKQLALRF